MTLPRVLILTDRTQVPAGRTLTGTVADCVGAGATHVVLRELDLPAADRAGLARELVRIPGLVLIAAHVRVPGADCVHLAANQSTPEAPFHGRSCHDGAEIGRALADRASYVTLSPVGPSESKPGYGPAIAPAALRELTTAAGSMPVFALGGVTTGNARRLRSFGAYGVAVMGSVMRADDPAALVKELFAEVDR